MTNEEFIQSIALPGEEWRDVPGYEGIYVFSSEGRVASIRTEIFYQGREKPRKVKPLLLKPTMNKTTNGGYPTLIASIHKRTKVFFIHRLVADAFVPNPNEKVFNEVDHIDGNTKNNRASNLRWTNRSGNMLNPVSQMRQSLSHKGKLIESTLKPVVRISSDGSIKKYSHINGAASEGFSAPMISMCCSGKRKTHKGYRWMYLSDYESQVSMSKNS